MSSSNGTNNTLAAPSWLDAGAGWAAPTTGHDGAQVPAAEPEPPGRAGEHVGELAEQLAISPGARAGALLAEPSLTDTETDGQSAPSSAASSASAPAPLDSPPAPVHRDPAVSEDPQAFRPAWDEQTGVLSGVVRERRARPAQGWRHVAYQLTGGRWNPGLSEAEARLRDQLQKIRTPLPGPHSIVVGSIKGGIGKTTVSALLGLALAEHRGDRVIAMDANPDAGTLGDRLVGETLAAKTTVRDLLYALDEIRAHTDLAGYTHLAGRLQVLTSEQEPALSEMFSDADYEAALRLLSHFSNAIITDSGTGIVHSAMQASLRHADSLVIVGAPTNDGASRAARTFRWLAANNFGHLTEDAVVVLSYDRHSPDIDDRRIREFFAERARAVVVLPPDPHLQAGGIIDFDALTPAARDAALELAATVAEGFQGRRTYGLASHGFRTPPMNAGGLR